MNRAAVASERLGWHGVPAWAMLTVLVVIGVFLRMYRLEMQWASRDECFSWRLIQYPVFEQFQRTATDVHPPLYYVLLFAWSRVTGLSIYGLRMMSVMLSAATIVLAYLCIIESVRWKGRETVSPWEKTSALVGAAIVAIHPVQVDAGRIARMYSLGVFLAVLTSWVLIRAMRQRESRFRWWGGYGLSVASFCYTHYFAFFTICGQALGVIPAVIERGFTKRWKMVRQRVTGLLFATALATIVYSPWQFTLLDQLHEVREGYWIGKPRWPDITESITSWIAGVDPVSTTEFWMCLATFGVFTATAVWWHPSSGMFWFMQAATPWILALWISFHSETPIFQARYLVFAHVGLACLLGTALAHLQFIPYRCVAVWLIGAPIIVGTWCNIANRSDEPPAVLSTLRYVTTHYQAGDVIVASWYGEVNRVKYYAQAAGMANPDVRCASFRRSLGHHVHVASLNDDDTLAENDLGTRYKRWWAVGATYASERGNSNSEVLQQETFTGPGDYETWTATLYSVERHAGAEAQ